MKKLLIVIAILVLAGNALAADRHVGSGQTYSTIGEAVTAASNSDNIIIHAGTYAENVDTGGKTGLTFINNTGDAPIVQGRFSVDNNTTIDGLKITGWTEAYHGIKGYQVTGVTVRNCEIYAGGDSGSASGVYFRKSTKILIDNCIIHAGIKGVTIVSGDSTDATYANGTIIRNSFIYDNFVDGVNIHGQYFTISGNQIYNNMDSNFADNHPDGIAFIRAIIPVDGFYGVSFAKISKNKIYNHTQNIFSENVTGGEEANEQEIYITENVIFNASSGTVNGVDMSTFGSRNFSMTNGVNGLYFYGNTIGHAGGLSIDFEDGKNGTYHFKNNIFVTTGEHISLNVSDMDDFSAGEFDYNLYDIGSKFIYADGTYYDTLTTFQAAYAMQETHGQSGTAGINAFPTPTPTGAGVLCVNNGATLGAPYNTDIIGTSRPQGAAWDIGAYEYYEQGSIHGITSMGVSKK